MYMAKLKGKKIAILATDGVEDFVALAQNRHPECGRQLG
jgi:hypothetical protein